MALFIISEVRVKTDSYITHRVTGAMVLIALAVVFLPLILDGQKKNQILESKIPAKPMNGEIILINIEESTIKNKAKLEETNNESETTKNEAVIKNEPIKEITTKPVTAPIKIQKKESNAKPEATKPVPVKTTTERSTRPAYKAAAYVIQLGSFSNQTNARKLVDKLKAAGYKAYLRSSKANNKTINRVLVGPELKRTQAESKLSALNKISGLKAIIVSYDPLRH